MSDELNVLKSELESMEIPKERYSLGVDGDESICMVFERGVWRVYFLERGLEDSAREFASFELAKNYFWELMRKIWP